jgi:ABC-2 type transport system ATP-binding protein
MSMADIDWAIQLKGLHKKLGKLTLGPIDIEIEKGYVIAVVGPNGSGKSSLFRLLMNIIKPDAGEVKLFGEEYGENESDLKNRIGYVSEASDWNEMDYSSIKELSGFVSRWYPRWDKGYYQELLTRYGLEGKMKLTTLSKGMQRKLAFIHAMAHQPDLLLLDEPTSGLDPFAWRLMLDDIIKYMDQGNKSVVFATHILDEVKRLADYVAFIYEGKLIGFYEKDMLVDGWKIFWVEAVELLIAGIHGMAAVESNGSSGNVKVISNSPLETEAALQDMGIKVIRTQAIELDEILAYLIRKSRIGTLK